MIMNSFCRMTDQQNGWPASNYMFKFNNRNSRTRCEICSKSTIKTPEWCHWRCSGVFIVNFEQVNACRVISSWNHCWGPLTMANVWRTVSRSWNCKEDKSRLWRMILCSSDIQFYLFNFFWWKSAWRKNNFNI